MNKSIYFRSVMEMDDVESLLEDMVCVISDKYCLDEFKKLPFYEVDKECLREFAPEILELYSEYPENENISKLIETLATNKKSFIQDGGCGYRYVACVEEREVFELWEKFNESNLERMSDFIPEVFEMHSKYPHNALAEEMVSMIDKVNKVIVDYGFNREDMQNSTVGDISYFCDIKPDIIFFNKIRDKKEALAVEKFTLDYYGKYPSNAFAQEIKKLIEDTVVST